MRQGLGRCVLTLRKSDNIEQYREIVLWGCLHNLSYDTQCEGTRAAYIYQLASCFHDDAYFIAPTIDAFQKLPRHLDWTFCHFFELLRLFAEKGSVDAKNALYEKYDVSWLLLPLRDASGIAIAYIDSRNLNHKGTPEKLKSLFGRSFVIQISLAFGQTADRVECVRARKTACL